MLLASLVLALLPLIGVALLIVRGLLFTVDGLFMTLILLAIASAFFFNTALEAHKRGLVPLPGRKKE